MKITPLRIVLLLLFTGLAALALYSLHVAFSAPDRQETVLFGQTRIAADGPFALRVLVRDSANRQLIAGADVKLSLEDAEGFSHPLGAFKTDADGALGNSVSLLGITPGNYTLIVASHSALGSDRIERGVKIFDPVRLLVSSDKPLYQPGQTIRLRALLTGGIAQKPANGKPITFEVSDSKGNKVFRESRTSSRFGIASADFALAPELNLGSYHVSALSGEATAEQTVEIKRYALPKFKVGVTTEKAYYLFGQELRGAIEAAYFFGQPVGGARVKLSATSSEKPVEIGAVNGVTNADGKFAFSILLPADLPAMSPADQNGSLDLSAEVTDVAGHVERKTLPVILAAGDFQITAFPEQGGFVPHVENQVFVIANEPDGQPSQCEVTANGRVYKTDAQGVCVLPVVPQAPDATLTISARDSRGRTAQVTLQLDNRKSGPNASAIDWAAASNVTITDAQGVPIKPAVPPAPDTTLALTTRDAQGQNTELSLRLDNKNKAPDPIIVTPAQPANATVSHEGEPPAPNLLLRPDKASYEPGAKVRLTVLSPGKTKTIFVDVLRNHQTVLTRSLPLKDYHGELAFDLSPELTGLLTIYAYTVNEAGQQTGVSRLIYVNPANGLRIAATRDREVYRPGETAKLTFQVTDQTGHPAPSALGIAIVDESLSALSESQPGFSQQSFKAGQQALSPRFPRRLFSSPMQLLQNAKDHPFAAQAYLASLDRQTDQPSLDELIGEYLNPSFVEQVRSMQGTPAYVHFRNDPRFAEAFSLLDNPQTDYSLSASTGAKKKQDVEIYRRKYFDRLSDLMFFAIFLLPIGLILYVAPPNGAPQKTPCTPEVRTFLEMASLQRRVLSNLTLWPYLYYIGIVFVYGVFDLVGSWFWLAALSAEILVDFAWCAFLLDRATMLKPIGCAADAIALRKIVIGFLIQFLTVRFIFCALCLASIRVDDVIFLFPLLLLTPPLTLASVKNRTSRLLLEKGVPEESQPSTNATFLIVVYLFAVLLAGIALPAFSNVSVRGLQTQALSNLKQLALAKQLAAQDAPQKPLPAQPRVRRDFPETLLWQPELITDDEGRATLEAPLADSITTWRASFDAVSLSGTMANAELPIRAFQEFFVEIELPESLTLGDSISVPAVCHNYLDAPLDVHVTLGDADWFQASPEDRARTVKLAAHEVRAVDFPITVTRVGVKRLRVTAQAGATGDALEREVRIAPSGRRIERTENNLLRDTAASSFDLPAGAIPDASNLTLKLYPSRFSEVVEGLDGVFHAPYGCFEQTSSVTYPNVLALDYLKSAGRLMPETEAKARKFVSDGYQRLLSFEVEGGGFELFGKSPASVWLTAYGVLEFTDMARVYPVDRRMIQRTSLWLLAKQSPDGSWTDSSWGETWERSGSTTTYVAWALAESGDKSPQLDKALAFLTRNRARLDSTYAKALAANAFLARDRNDATGRSLAAELADAAEHPGLATVCWNSTGGSMCYSRGESLAVETTALAALALMKDGRWPETVKEALTWISRQKNQDGGWSTTQATILALRALIAGSRSPLGSNQASEIAVLLNGIEVQKLHVNKENNDIVQLVSLTDHVKTGENRIDLRLTPAGELPYQINESYSVPGQTTAGAAPATLGIDVAYDQTTMAVDDRLKCSVTAQNLTKEDIQMPMIVLGIPPGFELETEAFESLRTSGQIALYEVRGEQVLLYLRELSANAPLRFDYFLRGKYPLRVQAPAAVLYEYYTPEIRAQSHPPILTVSPKP